MKKRVTQLIAAGVLLALPTAAFAAGARIKWSEGPRNIRYKLFVAQPDPDSPRIREFRINNPHVMEDGDYYFDVHGIDPLRPAYFLMVSINQNGYSSGESNTMELGSETFCEIFDVDHDGAVEATDALTVARKALGLKTRKHIDVKGSIILALEILKMVSTSQCT
jgi:hypothetical protein